MASNNPRYGTKTYTRLQEKTEKRRAENELKEKEELKRQKEMFALKDIVGTRDINVDSHLYKIDSEEDLVGYKFVEKKLLDTVPTSIGLEKNLTDVNIPKINLKVESDIVVKVEETIDLNESTNEQNSEIIKPDIQKGSNVSETNTSLEREGNEAALIIDSKWEKFKFTQNYIRLFNIHVYQKDQEINLLMDMIGELQSNSSNKESYQVAAYTEHLKTDVAISTHDTSILGPSNTQVIAELTCDLNEKDATIKMLSQKMLKLQDEILSKANSSFLTRETLESGSCSALSSRFQQAKINDLTASIDTLENMSDTGTTAVKSHLPKQSTTCNCLNNMHVNVKFHVCQQCGKVFSSKDSLRSHEMDHQLHSCKFCEKKFEKKELQEHLYCNHRNFLPARKLMPVRAPRRYKRKK